jgi:hypothetical protein
LAVFVEEIKLILFTNVFQSCKDFLNKIFCLREILKGTERERDRRERGGKKESEIEGNIGRKRRYKGETEKKTEG